MAAQRRAPHRGQQPELSMRLWITGIICLLPALIAAAMLVLEHIGGLSLPGCGAESACHEVTSGKWGTVPVVQWPVAFLGGAYFGAIFIAWLASRRGISWALKWIIRFCALLSLAFVMIMLVERQICHYCLVTHLGNFAFWIVLERARRIASRSWRPFSLYLGIFVVISVLLGIVKGREAKVVAERMEDDRRASTEEIIAASQNSQSGNPDAESPWEGGFTGWFLLGPERARVRIVMITDYQCPDCRRIESEAMDLVARHPDVSLSIKHFPMCPACNDHFSKNLHPNACWAARAAQAAGILRGEEGFYAMHRWLFDRGGGFTDAELHKGLSELGFDVPAFIRTMTSEQTLTNVKSDIEEAIWLGLHYTPMIFVNGVELKGIFTPRALTRTVTEVLARNPAPQTALVDQPPPALQKYVDDWAAQPLRRNPADRVAHRLGAPQAAVEIIVWGDYQEPNTAKLDSLLRRHVIERQDLSYAFRHFPVNQDCNPEAPDSRHPHACLASRAAEAAGQLGGEEAYWKMHAWLFANRESFSRELLFAAAADQGLAPDAFRAALENPEAMEAIREDCAAAKRMGLRALPFLRINDRSVPRWQLDGGDPVGHIIAAAAQEASAQGRAP